MANIISITEAAHHISALINSRSSSPRLDELEAIIAKTALSGSAMAVDHEAIARWDAHVNQWLDHMNECGVDDCQECGRLAEVLTAESQKIWARPVRTIGDVVLRAALCPHWNSPGGIDEPAYPDDVIAEGPECNFDAFAVAMVLRGIFDLTGLRFSINGQLASPPGGEARHDR